MELFTATKPPFLKVAATPLDEDPTKWSSQILQELFRQVPEASEYNPQYVPLRQDPEQGFALGVIVVSGQTDSALSQSGNDQPTSKRAMIPVIIKNDELCPLDLVLTQDKKIFPLNGTRLREALFRPTTFDMMTDDSGDQSLYSMFYPPGRASNSPTSGFSAGSGDNVGYVYGPGFKQSSKQAMKESLLLKIAPTLSQHDLDALSGKIASLGLEKRMTENPAFLAVISSLADFDGRLMTEGDAEVLMGKAASYVPVEVAQFGWDATRESYWMKSAARALYEQPEVEYITRGQLLQIVGTKVAERVDNEGTITLSQPTKDTAPLDTTADRWAVIEKPGVYRVRDINGNELTGWVLPSLVDFDGTRVPMAAFTNGAVASVQDTIVGSRIDDGSMNLPSSKPQGSGLFYVATPTGIEATVPFQVIGGEAGMDGGDLLHVKSLTGQEHTIRLVEGTKAMVPGDGEIVMPASAKFLPLNKEQPIPLMNDMDAMKVSALSRPYIAIRHGGNVIDFEFHDLPGFKQAALKEASYDDAIFTLCAAGLTPTRAHQLVKQAGDSMRTEHVIGVHDVRPLSTFMSDVHKTASERVTETKELRRDLLKEAAYLPDIQTVDSVLSLGYINPENLRLFVGKLPYLERALNVIGELVLLSRIGASEIPEAAAARAARALDEVIQSLKGLAMRTAGSASASATAS